MENYTMKLNFIPLFLCTALTISVVSCGGDGEEKGDDEISVNDTTQTGVGTDVNKEVLETTIGKYRFSVPSPIQMSSMIKSSGASFSADLVNSHENVSHYSTNFQKALNLGVYGADLGYLTMYGVTEDALSYLTSVRKLTDDLGISGAINDDLLTRFSDNIGKEDSMQVMVAEAYRAGNEYLQEDQRYDVIGLMLTGGFIESLHFATHVANTSQNQDVLNRIGSQKQSLSNLIGLLSDVNQDKQDDLIANLLEKLIALENEFNKIEVSYSYAKPKTVPEKKITYLTSTTDVKMAPETLENITTLIGEIRSDIID